MQPASVASPHMRPEPVALAGSEESHADSEVVSAFPNAMRGILIGIAVVLPFWGVVAATIWRLVAAH